MQEMQERQWRHLTAREKAIVARLLDVEFPGRDALRNQLKKARVKVIDEDGSLKFEVPPGERALVKNRVPVNAQCLDTDGIAIDVLLHVVDGRLDELELYKVDGSPMLSAPQPGDLSTY